MIPQIATITAGGSVNFIISGGHVLAVYDRGTKPEDISQAIEPSCEGQPLPQHPLAVGVPLRILRQEGFSVTPRAEFTGGHS